MPPAWATAIESDGGQAPAIGASRIGTFSPKRSQNAAVRDNDETMLIETPERLHWGSSNPAEVADQASNSTLVSDNEGATVALVLQILPLDLTYLLQR
jgi:hypothetical protein